MNLFNAIMACTYKKHTFQRRDNKDLCLNQMAFHSKPSAGAPTSLANRYDIQPETLGRSLVKSS